MLKTNVIHISTVSLTAEKLLLPQCQYLKQEGYGVSFVFSPDAQVKKKLNDKGFGVKEIHISRSISLFDLLSLIKLTFYLRREKPALVHTHTSKAGIIGRFAARLAKVPIVIHTIHGFPFMGGQNRIKYWIYVTIERWAGKLADELLCQSYEDVEDAVRLKIHSRNGYPIHISNGVDLSHFNLQLLTNRKHIRNELGISNEVVITIVARQNFEKGFFELITALGQIKDRGWIALFIGEDEGAGEQIKTWLGQQGISERVRLLGNRSDVACLLAASDIYVLPSYREGLPRSLIEAQAMQLPAVVTNIRGCREIVKDGENGFLVPVHDSNALAQALRYLIENPNERKVMGLAGRKTIEKHFDERMVFTRIYKAYQKLLKNRSI
ncbi:MAG: glycosyltransferase family 4 protein [Syntrophomonas sp.]